MLLASYLNLSLGTSCALRRISEVAGAIAAKATIAGTARRIATSKAHGGKPAEARSPWRSPLSQSAPRSLNLSIAQTVYLFVPALLRDLAKPSLHRLTGYRARPSACCNRRGSRSVWFGVAQRLVAGTLGKPPTRSRQVKTLTPFSDFRLILHGVCGGSVLFTTPFVTQNHLGLGVAEGPYREKSSRPLIRLIIQKGVSGISCLSKGTSIRSLVIYRSTAEARSACTRTERDLALRFAQCRAS